MNKITLLALFIVVSLKASAQTSQDFYNFSQNTGTYTDLANPTSMNNGQVWDWDDFGPFTSPFPLSVFGQTYNDFSFWDDQFFLGDVFGDDFAILLPITAYIMDRDFSFQGPSQSPISYQIDGTTGNRILKLEVKNVGLEIEEENSSTSTLFLNYQVWLYETDNSIEYHYGDHNITNLNMLNDDDYVTAILAYMTDVDFKGAYLDGNGIIPTPLYVESDDPYDEPFGLYDLPSPNTIYRFEVNPLSVKDQEKVEFSVFPNPTTAILNVSFEEKINKEYTVYDMTGRYVLSGTVNNENSTQIDVSALRSGTYILKIGATVNKFIKK